MKYEKQDKNIAMWKNQKEPCSTIERCSLSQPQEEEESMRILLKQLNLRPIDQRVMRILMGYHWKKKKIKKRDLMGLSFAQPQVWLRSFRPQSTPQSARLHRQCLCLVLCALACGCNYNIWGLFACKET